MAPLTILDLPNELLMQLPAHLSNIEDFQNVSSSCRRLRTVFGDTLPKTILRLASQSAPTFFSPHPDFLALAVAPQLAAWVVAIEAEREKRTDELIQAFRSGAAGILTLALRDDVEGVGLSMVDVRRMHEARFSVINPLNATIDAMIGNEWYAQPDFWNGGADDAFTLNSDVDGATMQLLLYGELFGPTMESYLCPNEKLPKLDVDERIEFVKYCVPDWDMQAATWPILPVGPYAEGVEGHLNGNQTALAHLVGGAMFQGTLWKRAWRRVLIAAGALENTDGVWPGTWRKKIQDLECKREEQLEESDPASADEEEEEEGEEEVEEQEEEEEEQEEESEDSGAGGEEEPVNDSGAGSGSDLDELPEDWRFTLFWHALTQVGGLQGMEMVAQFKGREEGRDVVMKPEWKARIVQLRDQVLALEDEDEPRCKTFGRRQKLKVSYAPDLGAEAYWCCAGLWGGL
ncbi:hypothetical protein N0V90_006379 [Kalmusia sp. IMI 367209]|nr:hypothetical protein N0V90_006379 [Kalmusia sp. IMI 367209]